MNDEPLVVAAGQIAQLRAEGRRQKRLKDS